MEFYEVSSQRSGVQTILQAIKDYGPISKRELQDITGLCWGHVSQVTKRFLEQGYIVVEEKQMTAGRTRDLVDINKNDNYFIGIDLNSERIRVVVADMKGRSIASVREAWTEKEKDKVLEVIYHVLDKFVSQYADKNILGIGFAVQGIVDVSQGVSVLISQIKNWENVPLKALIEERYGVDVVLAHDPDCLMKCESQFGVLKNSDTKDVLLIHYNYGLGIGMSIMINGHIYLGHQGRAGELDHTILNVREDNWHDMLGQYSNKKDTDIDMQILGNHLGRAIAIANSLFNPEIIVLHMAEADYQQVILESVDKYLRYYSANKEVVLRSSKLGREAKALGAALILIDREIDRVM